MQESCILSQAFKKTKKKQSQFFYREYCGGGGGTGFQLFKISLLSVIHPKHNGQLYIKRQQQSSFSQWPQVTS